MRRHSRINRRGTSTQGACWKERMWWGQGWGQALAEIRGTGPCGLYPIRRGGTTRLSGTWLRGFSRYGLCIAVTVCSCKQDAHCVQQQLGEAAMAGGCVGCACVAHGGPQASSEAESESHSGTRLARGGAGSTHSSQLRPHLAKAYCIPGCHSEGTGAGVLPINPAQPQLAEMALQAQRLAPGAPGTAARSSRMAVLVRAAAPSSVAVRAPPSVPAQQQEEPVLSSKSSRHSSSRSHGARRARYQSVSRSPSASPAPLNPIEPQGSLLSRMPQGAAAANTLKREEEVACCRIIQVRALCKVHRAHRGACSTLVRGTATEITAALWDYLSEHIYWLGRERLPALQMGHASMLAPWPCVWCSGHLLGVSPPLCAAPAYHTPILTCTRPTAQPPGMHIPVAGGAQATLNGDRAEEEAADHGAGHYGPAGAAGLLQALHHPAGVCSAWVRPGAVLFGRGVGVRSQARKGPLP